MPHFSTSKVNDVSDRGSNGEVEVKVKEEVKVKVEVKVE